MNIETIVSISGVVVALVVGLFGWIITKNFNKNSIKHYKQTQKIENDRLMKELFSEFNQRYDRINNRLDKISRLSKSKWDKLKEAKKQRYSGVIIDFFNISTEEYYWYKEKRLDPKIWEAWHKGMNDIYNRSEVIQDLWDEECKNEGYKSYYISKKDEIFKKREK